MKSNYKILGTSIFTAIASSLCCITPVLALISGTTGVASTFSWLEPLRPYLIGFTILVLGFAWYQKLKPKKEMDCDCETSEKPPFLQSKLFLGIITIFAIMMTAFPYYSAVFYPEYEIKTVIVNQSNIQYLNVDIEGMTCTSCEKHINLTVNQLDGIIKINSSYEHQNAEIEFDNTKTSIEAINKAINSTGYTVIENEGE